MRRALMLLVVLVFSTTTPLDAQSVRGRLLDAETDAAIAGGTVTLLSQDSLPLQSALSDETGTFLLQAPEAGGYRLFAERIGYRSAASPIIEMEARDTLTVEYRLSTEAVLLRPVTVVAYTGRPDGVLGGFYERMERGGFGTFISREQIEQRHPIYPSDLLRTVPGVQIIPTWWGRAVVLMRGRCVPQIYLDGMRIASGSIDDLVTPMDLEGIEVYRGLAGLPVEFAGPASTCGAIVLWTRRTR
jgi:hypothetical protein